MLLYNITRCCTALLNLLAGFKIFETGRRSEEIGYGKREEVKKGGGKGNGREREIAPWFKVIGR